jgi:hypothetical protein
MMINAYDESDNDYLQGNPQLDFSEKSLLQCHFANNKFDVDCPGNEPRSPR